MKQIPFKFLSKGQKQNKVPNICWYNGRSHAFTTYRNSPISIESKLSTTQCHFQAGVTRLSGQLKLSTFWPPGGNDALITYSRYIMSEQLCEQYLKSAAPVMGLQGCRMCREQEVHREELTAGRTWPCSAGWENWSFFSCSEQCCLNPICPEPPSVLRWPALECTCSTGPVYHNFMRCTIRKPTCTDFMGHARAFLSFSHSSPL